MLHYIKWKHEKILRPSHYVLKYSVPAGLKLRCHFLCSYCLFAFDLTCVLCAQSWPRQMVLLFLQQGPSTSSSDLRLLLGALLQFLRLSLSSFGAWGSFSHFACSSTNFVSARLPSSVFSITHIFWKIKSQHCFLVLVPLTLIFTLIHETARFLSFSDHLTT